MPRTPPPIVAPEKCVCSDEFEDFIRKRLFPMNKYDLMVKPGDGTAEGHGIVEQTKEPRFRFKSRENGLEFFVDARYTYTFAKSMIEWCRQNDLIWYQEIDNKVPVYIMVGHGPQPAAPRQVYFFPVRNVRFNKLLRINIEKFKVSITRAINEEDLLT
jgi:hypothetical protein